MHQSADQGTQAWETLYHLYATMLFQYGHKITHEISTAEDCLQDLFAELWQKKEQLHVIHNPKSYLFKAYRRKVVLRLQNQRRQKQLEETALALDFQISFSFEATTIEQEVSVEQQQQLQQALAQLSARQKEAIYLKFYENQCYDDIADIMKIDKQAVYTMIYKSMSQLRTQLKEKLQQLMHLQSCLYVVLLACVA